MSQTSEILKYMIHNKEITQRDAEKHCGCTRLSARIWDLQNTFGASINRRTAKVPTRYGSTYVAAYSLADKVAANELLKKLEKA